jgi:hypothetical protein
MYSIASGVEAPVATLVENRSRAEFGNRVSSKAMESSRFGAEGSVRLPSGGRLMRPARVESGGGSRVASCFSTPDLTSIETSR